MLKLFANNFNKNTIKLHKNFIPKLYFGSKSFKPVALPEENLESFVEDGKELEYVKIYSGLYPYMPLDDHPLIPGYSRILAVTRELTDKLKEMNVEKTKLVISVLRNPENVEALQAQM